MITASSAGGTAACLLGGSGVAVMCFTTTSISVPANTGRPVSKK